MSDLSISIPTDNDGYVLLQCSLCGEYFKVSALNINNDELINLWCPYCGLNGKQYAPSEAIEDAQKIAFNELNEMLFESFKELEKKSRNNKIMTFKCGKKPVPEIISPIKVRINNLEEKQYKCCGTNAKIKPTSKFCGSYCPRCGGINYE